MAKKTNPPKPARPPQQQNERPGREWKMQPRPKSERPEYKASGRLQDKVAFITGGDSGIGRAVAILFAKEGANVAISYLTEDRDAEETKRQVEEAGGECITLFLCPWPSGVFASMESLPAQSGHP